MKGPPDSSPTQGLLPLDSGAGAESWHLGLWHWLGRRSEPVVGPILLGHTELLTLLRILSSRNTALSIRENTSPSQQGWRENRNLKGKNNP